MAKDRTTKRTGPQVGRQPSIDINILDGEYSAEKERSTENRHGVPREVPGKTPGGGDRHHCKRFAHKSDLQCLKKGCVVLCAECGQMISMLNGGNCRTCKSAATEAERKRKEAKAREEKERKQIEKYGKVRKSKGVAKFLLAPRPSGIRKRTGRVGARALGRPSRRSQTPRLRSSSRELREEDFVNFYGMEMDLDDDMDDMDDDDGWKDIREEEEDVDRPDDIATDDDDQYQRRVEQDAALQHRIRESLHKLLS
ncbi:hypothetical protein CH063_00430 [Colletotrichum higginsianum]|uniref:Uncharacterized protein n=2 Tax=Colletotrichum higginsianum TaxID=80884 RepID=H1VQM2_COLHI|nr:hypothetical protein CH63R_13694 [Colletotrichum higginsianum IMI 349063]OBR02468.1 hypothetical protein CH63R_13694 [Colletotrichum higginsianum IMI 349063]TID07224.1 hypothetical protein CH35J_000214 [Colletotrichum higginsianum]GJD00444.1 hypothetical protein ColKHC_09269 [Colletotrichum higginsianum]CCF42528.1 hypothetical protein CH063_00430 [Colletotrichum higginsianum]